MLRELRIRNFAVIEERHASLCVRAQRPHRRDRAGKSMLIDAILLVRGARAQTDVIRTDAETATVEAVSRSPPRARRRRCSRRRGIGLGRRTARRAPRARALGAPSRLRQRLAGDRRAPRAPRATTWSRSTASTSTSGCWSPRASSTSSIASRMRGAAGSRGRALREALRGAGRARARPRRPSEIARSGRTSTASSLGARRGAAPRRRGRRAARGAPPAPARRAAILAGLAEAGVLLHEDERLGDRPARSRRARCCAISRVSTPRSPRPARRSRAPRPMVEDALSRVRALRDRARR